MHLHEEALNWPDDVHSAGKRWIFPDDSTRLTSTRRHIFGGKILSATSTIKTNAKGRGKHQASIQSKSTHPPSTIMSRFAFLLLAVGLLSTLSCTFAFAPATSYSSVAQRFATPAAPAAFSSSTLLHISEDDDDLSSNSVNERIQTLVESHSVLLFMKGSKLFPQCGFSNTACQILNSYNIDFMTVDVLADEAIRQGVKIYSQWPTIPQLYVCGEFIGGSDIMIELYQSG